jgi:hypothetical protein
MGDKRLDSDRRLSSTSKRGCVQFTHLLARVFGRCRHASTHCRYITRAVGRNRTMIEVSERDIPLSPGTADVGRDLVLVPGDSNV